MDDHATHELVEHHVKQLQEELLPSRSAECCATLIRIFWNILNNPSDAKFRSLRKGNRAISTKLCGPCRQALSLMFAVGFQEDDESYTFPGQSDFGAMAAALEVLQATALDLEKRVAESSSVVFVEAIADSSHPQIGVPNRVVRDNLTNKPQSAFSFRPPTRSNTEAPLQSASDIETLRKLRAERFEAARRSEDVSELQQKVMIRLSPGPYGMVIRDGGVIVSAPKEGQAGSRGVMPGWSVIRIADQDIDQSLSEGAIMEILNEASIGRSDYTVTFRSTHTELSLGSHASWSLEVVTEQFADFRKSAGDSMRLAPRSGDARTLKL